MTTAIESSNTQNQGLSDFDRKMQEKLKQDEKFILMSEEMQKSLLESLSGAFNIGDNFLPYPAGDEDIYSMPMNQNGNIIPSKDGVISEINLEEGFVTVTHEDGTTSRYSGLEDINSDMSIGDGVDRNTIIANAASDDFLYQRYFENDNGSKDYVVPGRNLYLVAEEYNFHYGQDIPEPPVEKPLEPMQKALSDVKESGIDAHYDFTSMSLESVTPMQSGDNEKSRSDTLAMMP